MTSMRISQLAERSGVPATTLRYYESAGLLPADRTPSGYRLYGEDAVERLAFIGAAKHLGLPLEEIGALLRVWEAGACKEVKADLRPRIAARLAEAETRAAELAAFTASLHGALAHLDALPDRTGRCDPECGFLSPAPSAGGGQLVDVALAPSRRAAEEEGAERWHTASAACSLTGVGLHERTVQWREAVDGATRAPVPEGLRLTLPVERTAKVAELAAAEQRCCPFFDFRLRLDGSCLHLEVRAPADGAALLADLFGPTA
ncbi:MerR family transcriptional regulator [Streptomyces scopuliridis]|uniref:MerR family transcriptional regulator n=1 Tax=Streptomyces scopuliridis TaxID=452529 RepID=A0ACD4ZV36_9ACTN|nr:MerR family transcriptional regulator [Streptomyces scopuliridis]WSB37926.1 MerR family transcriptional regulator [Streptomyces scopuliridis]WSC02378.1 MerR family transcriptional regulator [Streptomyces scopuliridis]WSC04085.1 MerR family transcriptional regulator [Streptomyces scopuliridis]